MGLGLVAPLVSDPLIAQAHWLTPAFSGSNFGELLAEARANPGQVRWATSGAGMLGHMVRVQVQPASHSDLTHIPYKGGVGNIPAAGSIKDFTQQIIAETRNAALILDASNSILTHQ